RPPEMRSAATQAGGRGVGESDYFASMTDLMLGLVFIFIIMLMAFALNMREAEHKMSDVAQSLGDANLARRELLRELGRMLEGTLPVSVDEENGTLQLGGDVLFPKGSADAYPEALPKLRMLGAALNLVLPCYADPVPAHCAGTPRARLDALLIE